jgi:SAM-dependent methyltransferase
VHEILNHLPPGSRVLDLGSASGSFDARLCPSSLVVRVDREPRPGATGGLTVAADAAALPFSGGLFDAVISNHSLEHFADLAGALAEIARVLKPGAAVYVAVPDATTFSDRLYRWLASGGGHLNPFHSSFEVASLVTRATGLALTGQRTLHTSLSFLHPANRPPGRAPRKLWLLLGAGERVLFFWNWLARMLDRRFGTRLSVYGWALYFGRIAGSIDSRPWGNVCLRCGSGHPASRLEPTRGPIRTYRCPACGTRNPFASG